MLAITAQKLLDTIGTLPQNPNITSVVTDSRRVEPGSLFVCIQGERVDGHDYAVAALEKGAVGIVAQRSIEGVPPEKVVFVTDPYDALITMGANFRAQFSPVLVGITGSVGKTTTKEFCYAVLSAFGETLKTEGNQNNEIGMPNTLFRLTEKTQYAVVEMGMQGLGEIHKLTMAAKPCAAVISNIGRSHLLQLGTRENICKAKLEICDGLPEGAPLILNADDDFLPHAKLRTDLQPTFFGINSEMADVRAEQIVANGNETSFTIVDKVYGTFAALIPAMGEHNVRNALSAYALGTRLGLDAVSCVKALQRYETTGKRQHLVTCQGIDVIEDCYNANPDSMAAALKTLQNYETNGKRIAVLGDMLELGAVSEEAHREVGKEAAAAGVDVLLCLGEEGTYIAQAATQAGVHCIYCGAAHDEAALHTLAEKLAQTAQTGDTVLVKASNGMHFTDVLTYFYALKA